MADERRDKSDRPNGLGPGGPGQGGPGQGGPGQGGRRFGRRRFGRGPRTSEAGARDREPEDRPAPPLCPLCGKPIYDLSTAMTADKDTGLPAHFDCVVERIGQTEKLEAGERLVYLGSGAFGVVEYRDKSESAFTVKRRIQWEKEGEKKDWRKSLSARIAKL